MKLASIETIKLIRSHSNADRLELVQVMGWQSVVQSGLHKEGDKVVFIVIDTILPQSASWAQFLVNKSSPDKPVRLKMVNLRGEHSAGLVIPLCEFPASFSLYDVGTDVTELLGIKKYIKELPANLAGENIGDFPTDLISKTDEDNGLSNFDIVEEVIKSPSVTITQKLDGSSMTVVIENGTIVRVCSRNLSKKDTENSLFWKVAKKLNLTCGFSGILQGELVGPSIQKNPLQLEDHELFVFQVKKSSGEYMNHQEMKGFCNVELKCHVVPLVSECSFIGCDVQTAINKLQELADIQTYVSKEQAEGIVIRPSSYPRFTHSRRPLGFKILNRNYKEN
jgi:RNA ligase (TIGR02306 family)